MVSWRGVAKKRRKQEAGGNINQMFAYCCGHATIVARRQPLFGLIEAARDPLLWNFGFQEAKPSAGRNLRAIDRNVSPTFESSTSSRAPNGVRSALALPRTGQHDSND
jgi:hypothetical protein